MKEIITIAGKPGSGKSTAAKAVAKELGYEHFSSGDFMRKIAQRRGVTIEELGVIAKEEHAIDEQVDQMLRDLGEKDKVVIDSRLAFHWIPHSFKVFLDLDPRVSAERIFNDQNPDRVASGEVAETADEIRAGIENRLAHDQERYDALYGVNPYDHAQFDLVIDTTENPPDNVVKEILEKFRAWQN